MPLNLKPTLRGSRFVHVGIDVKLHPVRFVNSAYRHPQIHWNAREEPLRAYRTGEHFGIMYF